MPGKQPWRRNERVDHSAAPDDDAPHLLVVDDDTRIRNLLKQYLTENGFRVTVAGNAGEAGASWPASISTCSCST